MSNKGNILLVEDDANFGLVLCDYLKMNQYTVDLAVNGKIGYTMFQQKDYDLCILDVMMPEMDGFTLAREISKKKSETPFFFLTAKSLKKDIVEGYSIGAVDYLNKPFDPEILLLKIQAILHHQRDHLPSISAHYSFLDYQLDRGLRKLTRHGKEETLSPKECQLLVYLLENRNQLVKREQVLNFIWKENSYFTARSMDVYVNKLRKRFKGNDKIALENIRGEGFILVLKEV